MNSYLHILDEIDEIDSWFVDPLSEKKIPEEDRGVDLFTKMYQEKADEELARSLVYFILNVIIVFIGLSRGMSAW